MSYQNICTYCNKTFTTKYTLITHQKTSKSCKNNLEKKSYDCNYCNKHFSSSNGLQYHINICDTKKDMELKHKDVNTEEIQALKISNKVLETKLENSEIRIEEYKKQIEEYKKQIELLQRQPRITNNTTTTVNNDKSVIFNSYFTPEFLKEGLNDYDQNHVCHGMSGFADFLKTKFLTKDGQLIYTCTDPARQHFKFIYNGIETSDKNATMLLKSVKPAMLDRLTRLFDDLNDTQKKIEDISTYDRTERERKDLEVLNFIRTYKLIPLNIDINELETNNKLSLALSKIV